MDFLNFSSYDTETWSTFFQDNWIVLVIAAVVLFLIVRIVKTVVKWAIVAAVVLGLVLYSGYSLDDMKEISTQVMADVKDKALNLMVGDAKEAKYTVGKDGTYTVKTDAIELKGKAGANEVQVSVHGSPFVTFEVDGVIKTFIDQAKQNG
ncbi:hypothetical protein ACFQZE_22245 [Paenibacillus sp. GCM10027627]|uniref:hypothetical protein n=1 Tax=unclassified Paenibacillus TaxID=185978 RepID=UPI00363FED80